MLKKPTIYLMCLFLLACTPKWQDYHFADGAIQASFPQTPQAQEQVIPLAQGAITFNSQLLMYEKEIYRLSYYRFPTGVDVEPVLQELLRYTRTVMQLPEVPILQKQHDYYLSNMLRTQGKDNMIQVRVLWQKDYLIFAYVFSNSHKGIEHAEKFLKSVQVLH